MRLHKYMAYCGAGSRRHCEEMIREGRVTVNGIRTVDMGVQVDPEQDRVQLDGKLLSIQEDMVYILLNKPRGTITSVSDQFGRNTVLDTVSWKSGRIYPVGRLDYDTEGLLILTNDGNLAYQMTHPRHEIEKEYLCIIKGIPSPEKLEKIEKGIDIGGYVTSPARISRAGNDNGNAVIHITIKEGKNRQVRRMFEAIGHPVIYLKRIRMASLTLGSLKTGEWRYLTQSEIAQLKSL